MGKFRALFVLNLKAILLTASNTRGRGRRRMSGVGILALLAVLALYLSATYSFSFARQLAQVGMTELVLMMMPVLVTFAGLMYTVLAVQGVVFGGKDNDLMLSMPVTSFQLMLARVLAITLENLVFSLFIMLPAGVAYAVYTPGVGVGFFLLLPVGSLLLALLPTTLSLLLGCALTWVSSRFTKGNALVRNLLYLLFFGVIMAVSFQSGDLILTLAERAAGIRAGFSGWGLPFVLLQEGICGNALSLLLFAALCILPFLGVVWLFGQRYQHLVTALNANSSRSDYKLGSQSAAGATKALLAKEGRRFFTTTIYFINAGLGLILLLVGAGAALIKGRELTALFGEAGDLLPLTPLLALAGLFCLSMSGIACSSVSLEGKHLWVLKESPVGVSTILGVKWGFELLLTLPCALIAAVCVTIGCGLTLPEGGALALVCATFAFFHAPFGLWVNLCFPKLDAANEVMVVKQSLAAFLGIFLPMAVVGLGAAFYVLTSDLLGQVGCMAVFSLIQLVLGGVFLVLVNTRGVACFAALD